MQLTFIDNIILQFDQSLRTLSGITKGTERCNPSEDHRTEMTDSEKTYSQKLMRVNHCGEICAQALYQGQALTARDPSIRALLCDAAREEIDHLHWCENRIKALDGRTSLLNPLWHLGAFTIGAFSGLFGDKWSLGFLAETENQVSEHLDQHLSLLPKADSASYAILAQMKVDEEKHSATAMHHGGEPLPWPVPALMRISAKCMTTLSFYL